MFGKGTTHKLKPKSLQPLTLPSDLATLMLDSKQLVQYITDMPSMSLMTSQKRRMMERGILIRMEREVGIILTSSVSETYK